MGASWVVDKILSTRVNTKGREVQVKWKDHRCKDSWEGPSSFVDFLNEDLVEYTSKHKIVVGLEEFLKS